MVFNSRLMAMALTLLALLLLALFAWFSFGSADAVDLRSSQAALFFLLAIPVVASAVSLLLSAFRTVNSDPPGADTEPITLDGDGNPVIVVSVERTGDGFSPKILGNHAGLQSKVSFHYMNSAGKQSSEQKVNLPGDLTTDGTHRIPVPANQFKGPDATAKTMKVSTYFWVRRSKRVGGSNLGLTSKSVSMEVPNLGFHINNVSVSSGGSLTVTTKIWSYALGNTGDEISQKLRASVTVTALSIFGNPKSSPPPYHAATVTPQNPAGTPPRPKFTSVFPVQDIGTQLAAEKRLHIHVELRHHVAPGADVFGPLSDDYLLSGR